MFIRIAIDFAPPKMLNESGIVNWDTRRFARQRSSTNRDLWIGSPGGSPSQITITNMLIDIRLRFYDMPARKRVKSNGIATNDFADIGRVSVYYWDRITRAAARPFRGASRKHIIDQLRDDAAKIAAVDDAVDEAVFEEEFARLKPFGKPHPHGLLDHFRSREAD